MLGYCGDSLCSVRYITIIIKKGEAVKMCVHLLEKYIHSDKKHFKRWDTDFLWANINVSQQMQRTLRPITPERPAKVDSSSILNWFQIIYQRGRLHLPIVHDGTWQIYAEHGWMFPPTGLKTLQKRPSEWVTPGLHLLETNLYEKSSAPVSEKDTTTADDAKTHCYIFFSAVCFAI